MRIVFVNNIVAPYTHRVFEEAGRTMDGRLVVISCAPTEPGRQWLQSRPRNYEHRVLPGLRYHVRGNRNIYMNTGMARAIRDAAPDAVFTAGYSPTMLLAALHCIVRRIPLGVSFDGWEATDPRSLPHRLVRKLVIPRAKAGIGASQASIDVLERYGLERSRLFVSPLVPAWDAPERVPDFAERTFDILWSGAINDFHKGVDFFVDAVIQINRIRPGTSVRIIGDGERRGAVLERLASESIAFRYDGFLQQDQLAEAYSSARVMLFPTRRDTWGLVANEAAQCGTPVVISDRAGAAGHLVRNGVEGFVAPLEQSVWIARTNSLLADSGLWARMSRAARATVESANVPLASRRMIEAFACASGSSAARDTRIPALEGR